MTIPHTLTVAVHGRSLIDRAALVALVETLPGLVVVPGTAANPPPHILLCQAMKEIPSHDPETAVLLLVDAADPLTIPFEVSGLFAKSETPAALGIAIRQVARGEQYLSPVLALTWLKKQREKTGPAANLDSLTRREREILVLLGTGLSNKAIAARLYLSVRTIEGHVANLYAKLGIHSRTEAVLIAAQSGE